MWPIETNVLLYSPGAGLLQGAPIHTETTVMFGPAIDLPRGSIPGDSRWRLFDVSRDAQRLIGLVNAGMESESGDGLSAIQLVLHWSQELKQRVPTR
jgi:hypothetical protein